VAVVAASILAGCSKTETTQSDGAAEREYPTGSDMPRKNRSGDKVQTSIPSLYSSICPE
jgi:hypothetical protein